MKALRLCIPSVLKQTEVITNLFASYLESRDVVRVRRTCHVALLYWKDILPGKIIVSVAGTKGWVETTRILPPLSRLERLHIKTTGGNITSIHAVLEMCPRLSSLEYVDQSHGMTNLREHLSLRHLSFSQIRYGALGYLPPTLTALTCTVIMEDDHLPDTDAVWEHLLSLPLRRLECRFSDPDKTATSYRSCPWLPLTPKRRSTLFERFAPVLTHFYWGYSGSLSEYPRHRWPHLESLTLVQPVSWQMVWNTFDMSDTTCLTHVEMVGTSFDPDEFVCMPSTPSTGSMPGSVLHLALPDVNISEAKWKHLAREHGNILRSLEVDTCNWNVVGEFTQLRSLTVNRATKGMGANWDVMLPPYLTHLVLASSPSLRSLLRRLPRTLLVLKIFTIGRVTQTDLRAVCEQCPALREIELHSVCVSHATTSIPVVLDMWLSTCHNLQRLRISYCRRCGGEDTTKSIPNKVERVRSMWEINIRVNDALCC